MPASRQRRLSRLLILLVTLLAAAGTSLAAQPAAAATPARVMLLGDSITGNNGCWRALLWQHLQATGHTDVDFVGTQQNPYCQGSFDIDNEGHGGFLATGIANDNQLPGWLSATGPDVVMMMLGTNDVWSHLPTSTILDAYTTLLGQMRAENPDVKLIVAQIPPMNPSGCTDCAQGVVNLNNAIPGWAATHSTEQSPVTVVDQWTGFDTATDTTDGVHPNETTGIQKLESRWYPALTAALGDGSNPDPDPGTGACRVAVTTNSWNTGLTASITVTNTGTTPVNGWSLGFTLPDGQTITSSWNATFSTRTGTVTAVNAAYNATIAPSASVGIGFQATHTGNASAPTAFTLNNSACTTA
ncbi:cellulose binding domain-containing protein [Streptomyces litchfieldiae]|uniref:Cellulose binding domain-containing protein n=1 Tax=Streptomyces litchfieldiae TaxID=3075543 RepID=A0ABU2N2U2_9ACTN|nr:cellulose binding domain-containing protein [Streptomyces sp. DSM 44938]MDT0347049.1 cellulose binding domain-containing protein [Streptomyces sp. DSM 44938]